MDLKSFADRYKLTPEQVEAIRFTVKVERDGYVGQLHCEDMFCLGANTVLNVVVGFQAVAGNKTEQVRDMMFTVPSHTIKSVNGVEMSLVSFP